MKKGIHPEYREVVFQDPSADFAFLTRSTITTNETIKWEDGKEYPVVRVEISSASHPFYTGKQKFVDTAGRVEKFQRRHSWDNSTMGKVLEKEVPKKKPRKVEKVVVGLPRMRKKKDEEEADDASKGKGRKGGTGKAAGAAASGGDAKKSAGKAPGGKAPGGKAPASDSTPSS